MAVFSHSCKLDRDTRPTKSARLASNAGDESTVLKENIGEIHI